jgi:hypothetical protein
MAEVHGNRIYAENAGKTGVPLQSGAETGALDTEKPPIDRDLAAVNEAWPTLPEAIKAGILAMIRATGSAG